MFGQKQLKQQIEMQKLLYEAHIASLKNQLDDVKKLVFTQPNVSIPLIQLEADAVLSQREETIVVSEEELQHMQDIESEANRILSGTY